MTVAELITELLKVDPEARVMTTDGSGLSDPATEVWVDDTGRVWLW